MFLNTIDPESLKFDVKMELAHRESLQTPKMGSHFFKSAKWSVADFWTDMKFEEISSKYLKGWSLSSKSDIFFIEEKG